MRSKINETNKHQYNIFFNTLWCVHISSCTIWYHETFVGWSDYTNQRSTVVIWCINNIFQCNLRVDKLNYKKKPNSNYQSNKGWIFIVYENKTHVNISLQIIYIKRYIFSWTKISARQLYQKKVSKGFSKTDTKSYTSGINKGEDKRMETINGGGSCLLWQPYGG